MRTESTPPHRHLYLHVPRSFYSRQLDTLEATQVSMTRGTEWHTDTPRRWNTAQQSEGSITDTCNRDGSQKQEPCERSQRHRPRDRAYTRPSRRENLQWQEAGQGLPSDQSGGAGDRAGGRGMGNFQGWEEVLIAGMVSLGCTWQNLLNCSL